MMIAPRPRARMPGSSRCVSNTGATQLSSTISRRRFGVELLEAARGAEARVVHEHGDLEIGDRVGDAPGPVRAGEIGRDHACRDVVGLLQLRGELAQPLLAARREHDREAIARESARELGANSG